MKPQASTAPKLLRPGGLRDFARLAAEATAVGVFASLVLLVAALFIATAEAASPDAPPTGTLLFKGGDATIPAPLLATDVRIDVAGIVARTRVTQRFVNPGDDWREGVYVFPLPEKAAVDHLRDAHRRAPHRGPDPRARAGAARVRAGEAGREEGGARRAGAAEHVHDERRADRAERGDRRADRVPADAALRRRRVLDPLPDGDHAALHPRHADRHGAVRHRLGAGHRSRARRIASHAAVVHPGARQGAPGHAHRQPGRRLPAREAREPLSRGEDRRDRRRPLHGDARRPGAGRPRLRAAVDARRRAAHPAPRCSPSRRTARPTRWSC